MLNHVFVRRAWPPSGRSKVGFSLIEMLVVIAIIATLAGILLPVLGRAKTKAREAAARAEIRTLQLAIASYKATYGYWPGSTNVYRSSGQNPDGRDFTYGTTWANGSLLKLGYPTIVSYGTPTYQICNAELVALLRPLNLAPTPELSAVSASRNPQQLDFLHARIAAGSNAPGLGPDGVLRDPWGNPYIVTLDLDFDDRCIDGFYGPLRKNSTPRLSPEIKAEMLIWSFGADGKVNPDPAVGVDGGENKDNIVSWQQ
jgi:prepilin-type N-terminal cleavage/methylation domain-containing protein